MNSNTSRQQGWLTRIAVWIRGERVKELEERTHHLPPIAYLLLLVTSLSVVLVFGHSELVQMLAPGSLSAKLPPAILLLVLVVSVVAADVTSISSMGRVQVLARNRSWMLYEHLLYIAFVMAVEIGAFGALLIASTHDPNAIFSSEASIIPAGIFSTIIVWGRAALLGLTFIQLFITSQKLPAGINTLERESMGLLGGLALTQLQNTHFAPHDLGTLYKAVAKTDRRPPRRRTWWNGWLCDMEEKRDADQIKRANDIAATLDELAGSSTAELEALQEQVASADLQLEELRLTQLEKIAQGVIYALFYYAQNKQFPPDLLDASPELAELVMPGGAARMKALPRSAPDREPKGKTDAQRQFLDMLGIEPAKTPAGKKGVWLSLPQIEALTGGKYTGEAARSWIKFLGKGAKGGTSFVAPFDEVMADLYRQNLLGEHAYDWWQRSPFGLNITVENAGGIDGDMSVSSLG